MDTTIVNVALPTIGRAFSVQPTSVDAVSISYLVSLAVFVPASGWLGDRFGGKRTLLTAVAVFTIASALCGMASNLSELVLFRVLQGAGGGMLASVGMAMLLRAFPPEARVRIAGMLTIATGLAPTLGPVLGGVLVTDLSWRLVFYVNVPVGICAMVFGGLFLRRDTSRRPGSFDAAGFLLAAAGLGLAMYGVFRRDPGRLVRHGLACRLRTGVDVVQRWVPARWSDRCRGLDHCHRGSQHAYSCSGRRWGRSGRVPRRLPRGGRDQPSCPVADEGGAGPGRGGHHSPAAPEKSRPEKNCR
jgi:MFS family permease